MALRASSPIDRREAASLRQAPPSSTGKATSAAMMFPLAMAWAYLDAFAKTWLAFGEKLHDSFRRTSHSRPKESESTTEGHGRQDHHQGQQQQQQQQQQKRQAKTKKPVNADDVDCSGSRGGSSRPKQHQPNRLEFSLCDFLAPILQRAGRTASSSSSSSTRRYNDGASSSSSRLQQRSGGRDDGFATATAATETTPSHSWPLRLRQHMASSRAGNNSNSNKHHLPISSRPRATDKTLVLDLDETLIHARKDLARGKGAGDGRFDFLVVLPPRSSLLGGAVGGGGGGISLCSGKESSAATQDVSSTERWRCSGGGGGGGGSSSSRRIYVRKRPYLKEFLQAVAKEFEVVVFTAARAEFANAVLDEIDPRREMVDHVLSRESCTRLKLESRRHQGAESKRGTTIVKDLGIIGRPLSKVIMVENSLDAIRYHLENGVHISSFYGDREDTELMSTLDSLRSLSTAADVRDGIIRLSVQTQAEKEGHTALLDGPAW